MSGLLQRLAARAIGQPPAVRPAACLPYAPAPLLVESGSAAAPQDGALGEPQGRRDRQWAASLRAPVGQGWGSSAGDEGDGPSRAMLQTPPAIPGEKPLVPPLAMGPPLLESRPQRLGQGNGSVPAPLPGAIPAGQRSLGPGQGPLPAPTLHPAGRLQGVSEPPPSSDPVPPDAETGFGVSLDQVVPLLPIPAEAPHAIRARTRPDAIAVGPPGAQGRVEETTEVHVSIGRIEVTAVHEAPLPKRPAQERPGPMTLEVYLAGRRAGGR